MLRVGDEAFQRLAAAGDAEELCRQLLASPWGWGSSTQHQEAIEILTRVRDTSELPASFVALMVCTCWRWHRVTARLITALEDSALLDQAELDELAESLLAHELVISYPLAWVSPQWLEIDIDDGTGRIHAVDEDTPARHTVSVEPPLLRWAAQRALRSDPARLEELLQEAGVLEARHRDAVIHGLLDAADVLDEKRQRTVIDRGLNAGRSSVRRTALGGLCELDGADAALRRARADPSATVSNWQPPVAQLMQSTLL